MQFDGQIVKELDARGTYQKTGQATFIHLIGSHTKYRERVPAGFVSQPHSDIVSQYDDTILYTDHVLSDLYQRFAGESLLFIYVSDHGQLVSEKKFGSGFQNGYQEEFRTPLLIWTDDVEAIRTIRDMIGESRLNLESFDDVVRYLTGLSPTLQISTRATRFRFWGPSTWWITRNSIRCRMTDLTQDLPSSMSALAQAFAKRSDDFLAPPAFLPCAFSACARPYSDQPFSGLRCSSSR